MTPADFRQIPKSGHRFEALVMALLKAEGYEILRPPAVGADEGCDILIRRTLEDLLGTRREVVVVQCKHRAHSQKNVDQSLLDHWENSVIRHDAEGFLLVTSTRVTQTLQNLFTHYTAQKDNKSRWARVWNVDELIDLLNKHGRIRDDFFPRLGPQDLRIPGEVMQLRNYLEQCASVGELHFDRQRWDAFQSNVNKTRAKVSEWAKNHRHFEMYYHFRRLPKVLELRHILSGQQLVFEKVLEARAVEKLSKAGRVLQSTQDIEDCFRDWGQHEPFYGKAIDVVREESPRLRPYTKKARSMVMVGCGALPITMIWAALTHQHLECTGLDSDNVSLLNALKVRGRFRISKRLHYKTMNGEVYDYAQHDVVFIANLVRPKAAVLRRVVSTAKRGTIIILRNPVTFGEMLWDDAEYSSVDRVELIERFDSEAFGQCFESVVLRCS